MSSLNKTTLPADSTHTSIVVIDWAIVGGDIGNILLFYFFLPRPLISAMGLPSFPPPLARLVGRRFRLESNPHAHAGEFSVVGRENLFDFLVVCAGYIFKKKEIRFSDLYCLLCYLPATLSTIHV
jgi:hypothetical protein